MAKRYESLFEFIDYFKQGPKVEWTPVKKDANGHFIASKPVYDKHVTGFLNEFYKINRLVPNYLNVVSNIPSDKPIECYTEMELLATLTKIINGEKNLIGSVAKATEDKRIYTILITLKRYC